MIQGDIVVFKTAFVMRFMARQSNKVVVVVKYPMMH